ncbi:hypothetical protein FVE85_2888 [Porphyridium purpureum]|uniref:Uncharacterized protein n=1 Tax=Porphyridium purpureum TaxID=35688 RepID=A0A5J4YW47_PORPP|nr:hypothetical protein FVE85_2888 [Porphyridium purpureum]|eukprot:POR7299..scf227_4
MHSGGYVERRYRCALGVGRFAREFRGSRSSSGTTRSSRSSTAAMGQVVQEKDGLAKASKTDGSRTAKGVAFAEASDSADKLRAALQAAPDSRATLPTGDSLRSAQQPDFVQQNLRDEGPALRSRTFRTKEKRAFGLRRTLALLKLVAFLGALVPFTFITHQYIHQEPVFEVEVAPYPTLEEFVMPTSELCMPYALSNVPPIERIEPLRSSNYPTSELPSTASGGLFKCVQRKDDVCGDNCDNQCNKFLRQYWKSTLPDSVSAERCAELFSKSLPFDMATYRAELDACRFCASFEGAPKSDDLEDAFQIHMEINPLSQCFLSEEANQSASGIPDLMSNALAFAFVDALWGELVDDGIIVNAPRDFLRTLDADSSGQFAPFLTVMPKDFLCELVLYSGKLYPVTEPFTPARFTLVDADTFEWSRSGAQDQNLYKYIESASQRVDHMQVFVARETFANGSFMPQLDLRGTASVGQIAVFRFRQEREATEPGDPPIREGRIVRHELSTVNTFNWFTAKTEFAYIGDVIFSVSLVYPDTALNWFLDAFGWISLFSGTTIFAMIIFATEACVWLHDQCAKWSKKPSDDQTVVTQQIQGHPAKEWIMRYVDRDGSGDISRDEKVAVWYLFVFISLLVTSVVLLVILFVQYFSQEPVLAVEYQTIPAEEFVMPTVIFCTRPGMPAWGTEQLKALPNTGAPLSPLATNAPSVPYDVDCVTFGGQARCGQEAKSVLRRGFFVNVEEFHFLELGGGDDEYEQLGESLGCGSLGAPSFPSDLTAALDLSAGNTVCQTCYMFERAANNVSAASLGDKLTVSFLWNNVFACCFASCELCCSAAPTWEWVVDNWDALAEGGIIGSSSSSSSSQARPPFSEQFRVQADMVSNAFALCDLIFTSGAVFPVEGSANVLPEPGLGPPLFSFVNESNLKLEYGSAQTPRHFPLPRVDVFQQVEMFTALSANLSDVQLSGIVPMSSDLHVSFAQTTDVDIKQENGASSIVLAPDLVTQIETRESVRDRFLDGWSGTNSALSVQIGFSFNSQLFEMVSMVYRYSNLEFTQDVAAVLGNLSGLSVFGIFFYLLPPLVAWLSLRKRNSANIDASATANVEEEEQVLAKQVSKWAFIGLLTLLLILFIGAAVASGFLIAFYINSPNLLAYNFNTLPRAPLPLPPLMVCQDRNGTNNGVQILDDGTPMFGFARAGRGEFSYSLAPTADQVIFGPIWGANKVSRVANGSSCAGDGSAAAATIAIDPANAQNDCRVCYRVWFNETVAEDEPVPDIFVDFFTDALYTPCMNGAGFGRILADSHPYQEQILMQRRNQLLDAGKIRIDDGSPLSEFEGFNDDALCSLVYFSGVIYPTDSEADFVVVKNGAGNYTIEGSNPWDAYRVANQSFSNSVSILMEQPSGTGVWTGIQRLEQVATESPNTQVEILLGISSIDNNTRYGYRVTSHDLGVFEQSTQQAYMRARLKFGSTSGNFGANNTVELNTIPSYSALKFIGDLTGYAGFFVGLFVFNLLYLTVALVYAGIHGTNIEERAVLLDSFAETKALDKGQVSARSKGGAGTGAGAGRSSGLAGEVQSVSGSSTWQSGGSSEHTVVDLEASHGSRLASHRIGTFGPQGTLARGATLRRLPTRASEHESYKVGAAFFAFDALSRVMN